MSSARSTLRRRSIATMVAQARTACWSPSTIAWRRRPSFPARVEDCYAALAWIFAQADALGVDPAPDRRHGRERRRRAGGRAGACWRGIEVEHALAFQHLIYPMIDDRTCAHRRSASARRRVHLDAAQQPLRLGRAAGRRSPGGEGVSPYAAAARAEDLTRSAADLHRHRRARPVPRRGHRIRPPAAARRRADRAARLSRRLPRFRLRPGGGHLRQRAARQPHRPFPFPEGRLSAPEARPWRS